MNGTIVPPYIGSLAGKKQSVLDWRTEIMLGRTATHPHVTVCSACERILFPIMAICFFKEALYITGRHRKKRCKSL